MYVYIMYTLYVDTLWPPPLPGVVVANKIDLEERSRVGLPKPYRGTSFKRKHNPPKTTIGP